MKDVLRNPRPSFYELFLIIPFSLFFLLFFTLVDVVLHDSYVLPSIAYCYPSQPNIDFCNEVRDRIQSISGIAIDPTDQIGIGSLYFSFLSGLLAFVFSTMFVMRLVLGKFAGARTSTMLFFIAFLWGLSTIILVYFGWEDTLYFIIKGEDIPDTLPWLNEVGFFHLMKQFGSDPVNVDSIDLKTLNVIGLIFLSGLWLQMMYHHKKQHLHKIGIRHK